MSVHSLLGRRWSTTPRDRDRALARDLGGRHGGQRDRERGVVLVAAARPVAARDRAGTRAGSEASPARRSPSRRLATRRTRPAHGSSGGCRSQPRCYPARSAATASPSPSPARHPRLGLAPSADRTATRCARRTALEWSPVSEEPLLISDVQARVVAELARIAPVTEELGARFAAAGEEIALVGGPVRDAMLGRLHNDLDFTTSARPEVTEQLLEGLGRRDLGHRPRLRHHRLPPRRVAGRDHHLPLRGVRPREPQARRAVRRLARRRPRPPRLHRELDGARRCPSSGSRTRSAAWSTWPTRCCGRRAGPRTPSPTTRCG